MGDLKPCVSYRPGSICADGFPLSRSAACHGRTCWSCGKPNDIIPPCQDENLGAPWLNEAGAPRLFPLRLPPPPRLP